MIRKHPSAVGRARYQRTVIDSDDDHGYDEKAIQRPEEPVGQGGTRRLTPSASPALVAQDSDLLPAIAKCLSSIPTGEIAFGEEAGGMPHVTLEIFSVGQVSYPYDEHQLCKLKAFAKELRAKQFGINWNDIKKTPTWVIPGSGVTVQHPEWQDFLAGLAARAAEYLGFGNAKLTTELDALYLWEKGSLFRDYHNEYYDPLRVGTLLIILNRDYRGGEVAIACHEREMIFDPAAAKSRSFFIASHNGVKYDNLPLTEGFRLGLSYDLRLPTHDGTPVVHRLVDELLSAERQLSALITDWALEIENAGRENHPLLFVLDRVYEPHDMRLAALCAADRAKALAVQAAQREGYGWHHALRAYLVTVTAVAKNYGTAEVGRRVKYAVERAVTWDGEPRSAGVGAIFVDERCVLQPGEFDNGAVKRQLVVGKMTTTSRTRTCLMLILEKAGGENSVS
ncbi:4365ba90-5cd0-4ebb-a8c2-fee5817932d9 [Thermothielavioides terrestris]|uniref:4365ba90-5cd0-4ebb-a8c2-fee5817932d9 n=1 Tax=Thermothielavioides terrestris TaxID=2587410 RepID=A0A3S4BI01_9PEZI|nr:4365ba90-5cd0-4ebb-a8c2-fee5817932d9 [Thermothielavioides terrestris]